MKSERRHELEHNSLALWLRWRAPELLEKYGTKVLLGVVIVALAVVLIRYRINAPKMAAANASDYLSLAREFVTGLENLQRTPGEIKDQATRLIQQAMDESDDPVIQSRAHLTLGDYYWALATYPSLPEAATRPAFRPELPRNELLTKAQEAYTKALAVPDEQNYLKARALISLAVVAEARAVDSEGNVMPQAAEQWKIAREQYEKVLALPNAPQSLKDEARWHIDELTRVQQPVFLVAATQPTTTQSATQPGATTLPSTQIVIPPITTPATVPATQPATKPNS
jgi:hypothetical protein